MIKRFRTLAVPLPNVNVNQPVVFTPAPAQRVRVRSLIVTLVTGANGAASFPVFRILSTSGTKVMEIGDVNGAPAAQSNEYVLSSMFAARSPLFGSVTQNIGLPWPDFWMPPGWQITMTNQQALDQFTNMTAWIDVAEDVWDKERDEMEEEQLLALLTA